MARSTTRPSRPQRKSTGARRTGTIIRPFQPGDLDALYAIRGEADRLHARLLPGFFRVPRDSREPKLERDATSEIFVAAGPDGVHGYVQVRIVDTPAHPAMTPARRAHVETLVVAEAQRRRGHGTRLMREARRWAAGRGATELLLTVWSENEDAAGFYRALGYRPVAQVLRKPSSEV
ncbi:MAG TPA: GNAT family N-acetyltransferase [Polyangia bacterium]|nr:GNAT family N-acetyltransferase [Polyangia bacterium]